MRIDAVKIDLAQFGPCLQGRINGTRHYGAVCELLTDVNPGIIVLLDFTDIQYVTGSWLSAVLVELVRRAPDPERDFFPILCNITDEGIEEVLIVAKLAQQCYLIAQDEGMPPERARLIGFLEPGEEACLQAIMERGGGTGAELAGEVEEQIGATAWNNRLKEIYTKRLLCRQRQGRKQWYFPVVKEIVRNGRQLFQRPG